MEMEHHALMLQVYSKFYRKFTKWVIETLEQRMIEWPTAVRKKGIKSSIVQEHGFQDAIGMIDGTHIILACRPNR